MIAQTFLASLGLLGLLATATPNLVRRQKFDCGTDVEHASADFLETLNSLHSTPSSGSLASRAAALMTRSDGDNSAIVVDTVFHIVAKTTSKDSITNEMPEAQLSALNTAYAPYGISFNLVNVTWTTNDAWAVGEKDADASMKRNLRQGSYSTLNIYFQTDLVGGVLGRCTLPAPLSPGAANRALYASDGCNVNANTMPDGTLEEYNRGLTAVHETGHWLGLLHTFEGYSCEGPGDFIDDTPPEREATDGCPISPPKSTCPRGGGGGGEGNGGKEPMDPIHNFMDYSNDECYEGFTEKQKERMHDMFNMYRSGK